MEQETPSNKEGAATSAAQTRQPARASMPSRDQLLSLLISEALRQRTDVWVSHEKLHEALRMAEERLSPQERAFTCSDPHTPRCPCITNNELANLADLGYVIWVEDDFRLSGKEMRSSRHELPADWAALIPFIREQLGIG